MYSTGRKKRQQPINLADIVNEQISPFSYLKVVDCGSSGKGVVATKVITAGAYVTHYTGEYLKEAPAADAEDTYIFEIMKGKQKYWIDATHDQGVARYLNDSKKKPNLKVKTAVVQNRPVPVFVANQDIQPGVELCYNYGPGRYFWRQTGWVSSSPVGDSNNNNNDKNNKPYALQEARDCVSVVGSQEETTTNVPAHVSTIDDTENAESGGTEGGPNSQLFVENGMDVGGRGPDNDDANQRKLSGPAADTPDQKCVVDVLLHLLTLRGYVLISV